MIFDRVLGYDREFQVFRNASGTTLARGTPVIINTTTIDGNSVILPVAGQLALFAGIAYENILDGASGKFQVNGYCDYATVANHSTIATIIGDVLGVLAAQTCLQRISAGSSAPSFATALEPIAFNAIITPVARKIWLRT